MAYVCVDPGVPVFGSKGASVHVQEVLSALVRLGIDVRLFASSFGGPMPTDLRSVESTEIEKWPRADQEDGRSAAETANQSLRSTLIKSGPFDIVYERYSLWSYAAMEYARSEGASGMLEVNAPLIEEQAKYRHLNDRQGVLVTTQRAFDAANHLIAVSSGVASYLATFSYNAAKVHRISNGVNPNRFGKDVRRSHPAKPGTFTVGFVSSLKPWHGLENLIDAFMIFHLKDQNTRLLIVGDGPERENLVKALTTRNLLSSAELTGKVSPAEIPGLLASMDVGLAPYPDLNDFYFSPLKIFEYMAARLPVVASRVGDIPELIQDGVNGMLVPPGDPKAIADRLETLKADKSLCLSLGNAARSTILHLYSWDRVVSSILQLAGIELGSKQTGIKVIGR